MFALEWSCRQQHLADGNAARTSGQAVPTLKGIEANSFPAAFAAGVNW
jgi:hypothetical protein